MDVLNMHLHSIPVRIKHADGTADYVTVQARRRVTLTDGAVVDTNWLAAVQTKVKTYDSTESFKPLVLVQAPVPQASEKISTLMSAQAQVRITLPPAPSAPAPAPAAPAPSDQTTK